MEINLPNPHVGSLDQIYQKLESSPHGLSNSEAQKRLQQFGENALPVHGKKSFLGIFISQMLNPLLMILLATSALSFFLGHINDGIFILFIVFLNSIIGAVQEDSAEKSAESLRALTPPLTQVLRQGEQSLIEGRLVVPGDILILDSGVKVAADARLIDCQNLSSDESALTGESVPVEKEVCLLKLTDLAIADRKNMIFAGTLINRGKGRALVVGTGANTELGRVAYDIGHGKQGQSPLLIRMQSFTRILSLALLLIILVMSLYWFFQGMGLSEIFLLSTAFAVSAIPEGLPVALTIVLSVATRKMAKKNVIVRKLSAVEALGSCTYIASDKTGTLTKNHLQVKSFVPFKHEIFSLLKIAKAANEALMIIEGGKKHLSGDAVDVALMEYIATHEAGKKSIELGERVEEIPYESELQFCASVHSEYFEGKERLFLALKGSPEKILSMCQGDGAQEYLNKAHEFSAQGLKVLGLAQKYADSYQVGDFPKDGFEFMGLVCLYDPPREDAQASIKAAQRAGIAVAMITGDHPQTALAIATQLGICEQQDQVLSGPLISQYMEDASAHPDQKKMGEIRVFARCSPHQKLNIVQALQREGHFVAVTGDGANDAPALKMANVGISMGKRGTDVARDNSDLILIDDQFSSIIEGVKEGRIAYRNIRKVVFLLLATGCMELGYFVFSLLLGLPVPFSAVQLLWLNLFTESVQHIGLAFAPGEGDELDQLPRSPREPLLSKGLVLRILWSGVLLGAVGTIFYAIDYYHRLNLHMIQNKMLLLFVLFENLIVFSAISERRFFHLHQLKRNKLIIAGTVGSILMHVGAMYLPVTQKLLNVGPLTLKDILMVLLVALLGLYLNEVFKFLQKKWDGKAF